MHPILKIFFLVFALENDEFSKKTIFLDEPCNYYEFLRYKFNLQLMVVDYRGDFNVFYGDGLNALYCAIMDARIVLVVSIL